MDESNENLTQSSLNPLDSDTSNSKATSIAEIEVSLGSESTRLDAADNEALDGSLRGGRTNHLGNRLDISESPETTLPPPQLTISHDLDSSRFIPEYDGTPSININEVNPAFYEEIGPSASGRQSKVNSMSVNSESHTDGPESGLTSGFKASTQTNSTQTLFTAKRKDGENELIFSKRQYLVHRLKPGEKVEKPWLASKSKKKLRYINLIMIISFICGLGIIAVQLYFQYKSVTNLDYCEVLIDHFDTFNTDVWNREVQTGGYGTGSFDWTTDSERNSYVENGKLYILPTLTNETISNADILNGYTVNLTSDGTCTGSGSSECWVSSNASTNTIIPPVQSARLTTQNTRSIKYGKIEIRAKMPRGDWLWPAIWLMPVTNTYGSWPASGEIDIAEARGNGVHYGMGGYDTIVSTLHWGPSSATDAYKKTTKLYERRLNGFANKFHTYGLEWNEKYIKTYIDLRLVQVLYHKFSLPLWEYGDFGLTYSNGSYINDPWPLNNKIAPFDQEFYLILNVAVGGTNGFFPDDMGKKPWINTEGDVAPSSFWSGVSSWLPSWPESPKDRAMVVDYVKMYKICDKKEKKAKRDNTFWGKLRKALNPIAM